MNEVKNKRLLFACWSFFLLSVVALVLSLKMPSEQLDKVITMYQILGIAIVGGFLGFQTFTDHKKLKQGGSDADNKKDAGLS